jgi:hypothetical protein
MSTDLSGKTVVAVIERDETRIWGTDAANGEMPQEIFLPEARGRHHHVREAQHHGGHNTDQYANQYYEAIANALRDVGDVLLLGHGKGKANSMLMLVQYLERHRPEIAHKIVGAVDVNMDALTEPQLLEIARKWYAEPVHAK